MKIFAHKRDGKYNNSSIRALAWTLVIVLLIGTASVGLGFFNYRNAVLDQASDEVLFYTGLANLAEYVVAEAEKGRDWYEIEALVSNSAKRANDATIEKGNTPSCLAVWLYNPSMNRISSAEGNPYAEERKECFFDIMPDKDIIEKITLGEEVKYIIRNNAQYVAAPAGDSYMIELHDVSDYLDDIQAFLHKLVYMYLAMMVVLAIAVLLIYRVTNENLRKYLNVLVLLLLVFGVTTTMSLNVYNMGTEYRDKIISETLRSIDSSLEAVTEWDDNNAYWAAGYDGPEAAGTDRDPHLLCADEMFKYYSTAGYMNHISFKDETVFNFDIPIEERVSYVWEGNEERELFECLISAILMAVFAVILYFEICCRDIKETEETSVYPCANRLKSIMLLQGIPFGMTSAILVVGLNKFAALGGYKIATVILIATIVCALENPLEHFAVTKLMAWKKSLKLLLVIDCIVFVAGLLVCGMAHNLIQYFIGYAIIQLCLVIADSIRALYVQIKYDLEASKNVYLEMSVSSDGGKIIGLIMTGILARIINNEILYAIAAVFALLGFILAVGVTIEVEAEESLIENAKAKHMIKSFVTKERAAFLFCILLTYGVMLYYYDYAVPLSVDNLGYSATIISFIYLVGSLSQYLSGLYVNRQYEGWLECNSTTKSMRYLLVFGVAMYLIVHIQSIATFAIGAVLIGLVNGFYGDCILASSVEITGDSDHVHSDSSFINSGSRLGNICASGLVSGGVPGGVLLGIFTGLSVVYSVICRLKDAQNKRETLTEDEMLAWLDSHLKRNTQLDSKERKT